jgi:hypothetical protein
MAQEFVIKSELIEDKINQLLPSQSGQAAGVDISASSMVVPVINLTEAAEGSSLRQDLQRSFSHNVTTVTTVENASNTNILTTTGYYVVKWQFDQDGTKTGNINLFDGATSKQIVTFNNSGSIIGHFTGEFNVLLSAGDSLRATSSANFARWSIVTRQIADINGNLTNPT